MHWTWHNSITTSLQATFNLLCSQANSASYVMWLIGADCMSISCIMSPVVLFMWTLVYRIIYSHLQHSRIQALLNCLIS